MTDNSELGERIWKDIRRQQRYVDYGDSPNPANKKEGPEIIYVGPRSFWDFLAEMERPKAGRIFSGIRLKWVLVSILAVMPFVCLFFGHWAGHNLDGWIRTPCVISSVVIGLASLFAIPPICAEMK